VAEENNDQVFDVAALKERADGDIDLLNELVGVFLDSYAPLMDELRRALKQRDARGIQMAAHSMKTTVGTLCAPVAFDAAFQVEQLAREGKVEEAGLACWRLEHEVARLATALEMLALGRAV
jgi:two-component system sensor histidine kinase/response regulator